MLNTFIEKIKTDKVYQLGLILFIGVIGLKIMVDQSTKKHGAALKAEALRVAAPSGASLGTKTDTGYSVTAKRPARGTPAGIALMNRQQGATATRAVASSKESWALNQSARAKPREEVWRQTSGYSALPGKGTPVPSYAGQRQVGSGTYNELKPSEANSLEQELAGVRPVAKKKVLRR